MAKYILGIHSKQLGIIEIGESLPVLGKVQKITFSNGSNGEDAYKESYMVLFENSKDTLEVFDVAYVVRSEYKNE